MDDLEKKSPSFFKVLFCDFSNHLLIPPAFVKHLDRTPANITLQVPDKGTWPVDVKFAKGDLFFQNGWSSFVQDNSLQHGDFLTFRYVGSAKFIVRIYGMSGCEKYLAVATKKRHDPPTNHDKENQKEGDDQLHKKDQERLSSLSFVRKHKQKKTEVCLEKPASRYTGRFKQKRKETKETRKQKMNQPSRGNTETTQENLSIESWSQQVPRNASPSKVIVERQKKVRAAAAASKFNSKYPFFKITIRPSYVKYHHLSLPTPFYKKYMEDVTDVTLQVTSKSWPVKMFSYVDGSAKFYRGWSTFLKENDVNPGDVCGFELIERNNANHLVFKVSIFKLTSN